MIHVVHQVFDTQALSLVQGELERAAFVDGKTSAGGMARSVKRNLQLDPKKHSTLFDTLRQRVMSHAEVRRLALPLKMSQLRVARYETGMAYGKHSDSPVIDGVRTDLSFSLFLSKPDTYEGGELVIFTGSGEVKVQLPAGSLVLYSTGSIHEVAPVTRGVRDVAVGWLQSAIRDDAQREVVSDLDQMRRDYLQRIGHDAFADKLLKCSYNLQRMWTEI